MSSPHSSSNPSSAFELLAEPVRRWIWDQDWTELRDIQERAITTLLEEDQDLIIAAPTAGGKTEAAFLPLISSVLTEPGPGGFDLVYVAPLRAPINDQLDRMEGPLRAGRVAALSVARRHFSSGEVSRPPEPAGRAVDHAGVSGSAVRAEGIGNPDAVRRRPGNHYRRTPLPLGQRERHPPALAPHAIGVGSGTSHPESRGCRPPLLTWKR